MSEGTKVGFFDSGVGGRSILDAFQRVCPEARTLYIADTEHCPYGNRPAAEVRKFAEDCTRRLVEAGCGIVVLACNTATAAAIEHLRAEYPDIKFVGLEPAVKTAALATKTGVVAVLATAGTFTGSLYTGTKRRFAGDVRVIEEMADEFVAEVERLGVERLHDLSSEEGEMLEGIVMRRVEPLLQKGADMIVLGCTHFIHLKGIIEKVCAGRAVVVDPSDAVAARVKSLYEGLA